MKIIVEINLKSIKSLYEITKNDKTIMDDRSLTTIIQDSIIWCFNTLNELIDTSNINKNRDMSKDQIKKENQVNLSINHVLLLSKVSMLESLKMKPNG